MRKPTGASGTEIAIALLLAGLLIALLFAMASPVFAASGMMGVGSFMGGTGGATGPPPPTFFLTDDAGVKLTDDAGTNRITTQ